MFAPAAALVGRAWRPAATVWRAAPPARAASWFSRFQRSDEELLARREEVRGDH